MRLVTPQPTGDFTAEEYAKILFEQPMEDWDELIRINLSSVYFSCVAFMPLLAANPHKERASIVTIGSISGTTSISQTGQYAYNVCLSLSLAWKHRYRRLSCAPRFGARPINPIGFESGASFLDQDACQ